MSLYTRKLIAQLSKAHMALNKQMTSNNFSFSGTDHRGEKVMSASKAVRQMQSSEFGDPSDSGRKADCLFMFGEIELSNIEFKRDGIDETEIRVQNRKNVRLGRCLQEIHSTYGVEAPSVLMADVIGIYGVCN